MQRYILIIVLCLSAGFIFLPKPSASSQKNSDSAADLIDALDDCIQQRFLDVDKGFGVRRLIRPGDTAHRFKPENAKELAVVEHLSGAGLDVVLYLAGRGIVVSKVDSKDVDSAVAASLIKGPILITTGAKQVAGLPTLTDLRKHGQEAMQVFQGSNRYNFNLGEWSFTARPVRASDATCLNCHQGNGTTLFSMRTGRESKSPQIGDPLGLLVYGYKHSQQ